jgi:ectoine hydroxylase-related dioxygenase (phytanoyl-CoA dioxygenase family)
MIQGSLSLDDEQEGNCTQILPGMHNHLGEWWGRVSARGQASDGWVHRITDVMFNSGTDWTDQPCKHGDVRITIPHLPHGAHGPSKGVRRTMLPWFVSLSDDLQQLENQRTPMIEGVDRAREANLAATKQRASR